MDMAECGCQLEHVKLIERAHLAEKAERYDDMAAAMKSVVERGQKLTLEERNLFTIANKNRILKRRFSWQVLEAIEDKTLESEKEHKMAREYREKVGKEIREICHEVLKLVEEILIPQSGYPEAEVFYLKMKGDYYRKLGEYSELQATEEHKKFLFEIALQAYETGLNLSKRKLAAADSVRLALMLNFARFSFEILTNRRKAIDIARDAMNDAMDAGGASNKDGEIIMELLQKMMLQWALPNLFPGRE